MGTWYSFIQHLSSHLFLSSSLLDADTDVKIQFLMAGHLRSRMSGRHININKFNKK